jgi:outer membrane protein OmpA-like peptidoglycan-associated protein/outer membrane protein W
MLRKAVLAISVIALPIAAGAQPVSGPYIGLSAGVNMLQDQNVTSVPVPANGKLQSRVGPAVALSFGWGFGNGLRAEIEGDYRSNAFTKGVGFGLPVTASGTERKFGPMVNVLYDFNGISPMVVPYVGAGIGYQWVRLDNLVATSAAGSGITASSSQGSFAYQAILGAAFPLASVAPGLALTAEYRFMGLAGTRKYNNVFTVGGFAVPGTSSHTDDNNHAFLVGIRYAFGAAPVMVSSAAAAAPAPMVQPSRSYLVFFDWDKATLSDRARQIIREAADNSTKVQYTRIEVNGYTDTSGTPQYNQGLSVRRAQAVAAELVRDGVQKNAIGIQGFGETHLLVPTGQGVREPQNRRVEIVIR